MTTIQYNPQMLLSAVSDFLNSWDEYIRYCTESKREPERETQPVKKKLISIVEDREAHMRKITRWANRNKAQWIDNSIINKDREDD